MFSNHRLDKLLRPVAFWQLDIRKHRTFKLRASGQTGIKASGSWLKNTVFIPALTHDFLIIFESLAKSDITGRIQQIIHPIGFAFFVKHTQLRHFAAFRRHRESTLANRIAAWTLFGEQINSSECKLTGAIKGAFSVLPRLFPDRIRGCRIESKNLHFLFAFAKSNFKSLALS